MRRCSICVDDTPTGAAAAKYAHFCPICYRHFAHMFVTRCCRQNICYGCMTLHINSKMGGDEERMTLPCPSCNTEECDFDRVNGAVSARVYDESPTTKQLLARAQTAKRTTNDRSPLAHFTPRTLARQRSDPYALASPNRQSLHRPQLLVEAIKLKRFRSIPEHSNAHAQGEALMIVDMFSPLPPLVSAQTIMHAPTAFTFSQPVQVAAT